MNYESFSSNCIFKLFFIMSDSSSIKKQILAITGFNKLNPMQIKMSETDDRQIILLAPTGSGKTIAFTIRLLRFMRRPGSGVQAVILAPSRELALQIAGVLKKVAPSYRVTPLFGVTHSVTKPTLLLQTHPISSLRLQVACSTTSADATSTLRRFHRLSSTNMTNVWNLDSWTR